MYVGEKIMYIPILLSIIIIIFDLLIFKGPLLNGIALILLFILLIISFCNKKHIKIYLYTFLLLLLSETVTISIGNYLNHKIKIQSEQIYKNINQYKFSSKNLNGIEIKEYETSLYNSSLSIYLLKNGYHMHVKLYNFTYAYFENGNWREESND